MQISIRANLTEHIKTNNYAKWKHADNLGTDGKAIFLKTLTSHNSKSIILPVLCCYSVGHYMVSPPRRFSGSKLCMGLMTRAVSSPVDRDQAKPCGTAPAQVVPDVMLLVGLAPQYCWGGAAEGAGTESRSGGWDMYAFEGALVANRDEGVEDHEPPDGAVIKLLT